jgi:hypothetical protein
MGKALGVAMTMAVGTAVTVVMAMGLAVMRHSMSCAACGDACKINFNLFSKKLQNFSEKLQNRKKLPHLVTLIKLPRT